MTRPVYIASARRSAVVPRNGAFRNLRLPDLGAPVLRAALADAGVSADDVGEVILSNALGPGGNAARSVALAAGLPERVGGLTIDRQCAGGLDAVILGAAMIRAGVHDVVVVGGAESYSRRPIRMHRPVDGGAPVEYDQAPFTPWPDRDPDMAEAADALARDLGITRAEQDAYAVDSHRKARLWEPTGEIVALRDVVRDPFTRHLSPNLAARARPVAGSISMANMAVAADGGAFLVLCADRPGAEGVRFDHGVTLGGAPDRPGLAPIAAVEAVLRQADLRPAQLNIAEVMEAFAVQAMACVRGAELPPEIVNPDGGSLARGHPIGASGAILAVHLFHALSAFGGRGIATIASAGGLGSAILCSTG